MPPEHAQASQLLVQVSSRLWIRKRGSDSCVRRPKDFKLRHLHFEGCPAHMHGGEESTCFPTARFSGREVPVRTAPY